MFICEKKNYLLEEIFQWKREESFAVKRTIPDIAKLDEMLLVNSVRMIL